MKCGNSSDAVHKDVVIVGNGPSGITLSYMLSGNIPYVVTDSHPDEFLSARLAPVVNKSLVQEDLAQLSNGLEGRTTNPISLLIDSLMHPCADIGMEIDSMVEWRKDGCQFEKFGHNCDLQATGRETSQFPRNKCSIRYWITIPETSKSGYNFLRSQKKIENERKKQLLLPYIIHPFSNFRLVWESIMCVVLILQFYMASLCIAYQHLPMEHDFTSRIWFAATRVATDLVSLIDVFVNFITGYCDTKNGVIVLEPRAIARNYIFPHCFLDLFCSIPFDLANVLFPDINPKLNYVLDFIAVLKLTRYFLLVRYSNDVLARIGAPHLLLGVITLIFHCITYVHVTCCFSISWTAWNNSWLPQYAEYNTIIHSYGPQVNSTGIIYIRFFYCACIMVLGCGYGLHPSSNSCFIYIVNSWLVSRVMNIFAIAYFMQLYSCSDSSRQKYSEILNNVKDYLQHQHMPKFLKDRVLAYYDIKYQNCYFDESEILNTVSGQLRQIEHVVLGKGPPGGSWHSMDPQILTLSLGAWMGLPGLKYEPKDGSEKRASAKSVAEYYESYVKHMELTDNFNNNVLVTSIRPFTDLKGKWVEKVNNDICKKIKLCSRLEAKEKEIIKTKSCTLSSAFNYFLARGQGKLGRYCRRPRQKLEEDDSGISESDEAYENKLLNILHQCRDGDKSVNFPCDFDYTCDKCSRCDENANKPKVPNNSRICDQNKQTKWIVEAYDMKSRKCITYTCNYLILANGSSDLPNRLNISSYKTDPYWLLHDLRSLEIELDLQIQDKKSLDPVLIVGAGLSAADAIIATRARNVPVLHVFRNKSSNLSKQLPENMYPEYHKVHQMMREELTHPLYTPLPEYTLTNLDEENRTVYLTSKDGKQLSYQVSFTAVLIGSRPDMSFLPSNYNLATKKQQPIDCKKNTINTNKLSHAVLGYDSLYALGPLAGDNFVRFLPGGALAVLSDLYKKYGF